MSDATPDLDEVYRKFGEAAEAAQLIETQLGTMLMMIHAVEEDLFSAPNDRANALLDKINRQTIGQLIKSLNSTAQSLETLDALLTAARTARNRLFHSFYREHNFRRNSAEGRALMLSDLAALHGALLDAYKAIMLLSGVDIDAMVTSGEYVLPTGHVPLT